MLVDLLRLAAARGRGMAVGQVVGGEGARVRQNSARIGGVVTDYGSSTAVSCVVRLHGLVVLSVSLMLVSSGLLIVIEHRHPLASRGAIKAGAVPLLVALRVHASSSSALGRDIGRLGGGGGTRDDVSE